MPLIDAYAELGWWTIQNRDGDEIAMMERVAQRYNIEFISVASAEAMRGDLSLGNRKVAELVAQNPKFRGYVVVNPNHLEASSEEMKRNLTKGNFLGIVLPPPSLAHPFNSWRTMELIKMARRYDCPFVAFVEISFDAQALVALTKSFPGIKFLMVPNQGSDWWAALKIVEDVTNISVVVSGLLTERGIIEQAISLLGERRVLWASGMTRVHPTCSLGMIQEAELTERQRNMIVEVNAKHWLSL
ncbi:MAG: amidohydrolase family protein [Armatimonadetes bacterium]|nr:amidohydrolase family protein [Armatimonadota bacterium]